MTFAKPAPTVENRPPLRSRPYLAILGTLPLRIQTAAPPPDLSAHPPAGAPPLLISTLPKESPGASTPAPSENSPPAEQTPATIPPPTDTSDPTTPPPADTKMGKPAKAILPDDTRPKVHAEDFLPFFQPPGANANPNDITVAPTPPAPGVQLPSTATYQQK